MLTATTVVSASKLPSHPDLLYCKCTPAPALCRTQAKPKPNKTVSPVWAAAGG